MNRMIQMILFGVALLGLLTGTTQARDYHLSLLGVGQVVADREYDPLSGDDGLALFNLEFGLELPEVTEGLSLELAYGTGSQKARLYAGENPWLKTRLDLHQVLLGAVYRLPLTSWLGATARLGASLDFAKLSLVSDGQTLLADWDLARLGGYATAGLEIALPRSLWTKWMGLPTGDPTEGFTLGLRFEAGWSIRQALRYADISGSGGGQEDIAVQGTDLGSVRLDGFLFRAGAYVVF